MADTYKFKDVLRVVCELNADEDAKRVRERLGQWLIRGRIIGDRGVGRGKQYEYRRDQLLLIALINEFNRVGVTPENARMILADNDWQAQWNADYLTFHPNPNSRSSITIDHRRIIKAVRDLPVVRGA